MTRDYTIVWLGIARRVHNTEELDRIGDRSHPLIQAALAHGLGYYCDTFDNEDADDATHFLLIGRNLGALGIKEGLLSLQIQPGALAADAGDVSSRLGAAGLESPSALHILYHVDH
jgi:hypothetical protein